MDLRYWRNLRRLSIAELSRISSVPIRTIEDIEKRGSCQLNTAKKLAEALNINLYDLASEISYQGKYYTLDLSDILNYLLDILPETEFKSLLTDMHTYQHGIHMKAMDKAYQLYDDIHTYGKENVNLHWEKTLPQW